MFLTSKSSPMASHGATTFPDLSLQISPPVAADEYHMTGCITNRPPSTSSSGSDFSQETTFNHHIAADMAGGLLDLQFGQPRLTLGLEMGTLNHHHHRHRHHPNYWNHHYHPPQIYPHQFKRSLRNVNGVRRSARAPRMRWTSTLHAHFIHAVQLLGGHERATPKSVQELMNVKDLTLAHVKSHLQMYRTVKSTDRGAEVINPRGPVSLFQVGGEISPSTSLQISQRISPLETNNSSYPMKENTSSDCPLHMHDSEAEEHEVILRLSKKIKELEKNQSYNSSSSTDDQRLLNLEFTLGRPCMPAGGPDLLNDNGR